VSSDEVLIAGGNRQQINPAGQFSRIPPNFGGGVGKLYGFRVIQIADEHGKPGSDQAPRDA